MKHIGLKQFQQLTRLSDGALLWLLKEGTLPCCCTSAGAVEVLLDSVQLEALAKALSTRRESARQPSYEELVEVCGEILTRRIGELASEVLATLPAK